jgi:hypothetical protein
MDKCNLATCLAIMSEIGIANVIESWDCSLKLQTETSSPITKHSSLGH